MRRKKKITENTIPTITRTHKIRIYPNKHNQEVFKGIMTINGQYGTEQ